MFKLFAICFSYKLPEVLQSAPAKNLVIWFSLTLQLFSLLSMWVRRPPRNKNMRRSARRKCPLPSKFFARYFFNVLMFNIAGILNIDFVCFVGLSSWICHVLELLPWAALRGAARLHVSKTALPDLISHVEPPVRLHIWLDHVEAEGSCIGCRYWRQFVAGNLEKKIIFF